VHEFRTAGQVTDAKGKVVFTGDRNDRVDREIAHRGIRRGQTRQGGHADDISGQAEAAFRKQAGLPERAEGATNTFTPGFWTWPGGGSEADGALLAAFTTRPKEPDGRTERHELVIYHNSDGGFARLGIGQGDVREFFRNYLRREREEENRRNR